MGRILEAAEAQALLKCAEARKAAVIQAAKEIKKDFKHKVFDQAVSDYYDDYSPSRYRRTESLYRAFKVDAPTDGRRIRVKYNWNANWLPDYSSRSKLHQSGDDWISRYDDNFDWDSDDNGVPEKGWIFVNFMEGVHPRFFVDKSLGVVINDSAYFRPSYLRIREYKDRYIKGGDAEDILIKNLKIQFKKM